MKLAKKYFFAVVILGALGVFLFKDKFSTLFFLGNNSESQATQPGALPKREDSPPPVDSPFTGRDVRPIISKPSMNEFPASTTEEKESAADPGSGIKSIHKKPILR